MNARVLVMAKAPAPGRVKTRLGAVIGMEAAADLAAAALLDTLDVCRVAFGTDCHLALDGDLDLALRGSQIRRALRGWDVFAQRGSSLGGRLAAAHGDLAAAGPGAIVQVGMDTPQLTAQLLRTATTVLGDGADAVLGPAEDGGWWVLGLGDGRRASVLAEVAMSRPDTHAATVEALGRGGAAVGAVARLRDVDTVADAHAVAAAAPGTRFARSWHALAVAS